MTNPRISVIMPVLLKHRAGITNDPEKKFERAILSFLDAHRVYNNSELLIVSDGCVIANRIVSQKFSKFLGGAIKLFKLPPRQDGSVFIGSTRQYAIDKAMGDLCCNLDADDYLLSHHLKTIAVSFNLEKFDWCYFNYWRKLDNLQGDKNNPIVEIVNSEPNIENGLCTINVAWKRGLDVSWIGADGKQDNKIFNERLIKNHKHVQKIYGSGYVVAHASFLHVNSN